MSDETALIRASATTRHRAVAGGAVCVAILLALAAASPAAAQTRCRVMDPTGTDLNVRATPNGRIVGKIVNGTPVALAGTAFDDQGRPWARVIAEDTAGRARAPGWVFREFVACW
ncbi:MAG: SH3 domain-containing protein [Beijerinckiaceae bacterium]